MENVRRAFEKPALRSAFAVAGIVALSALMSCSSAKKSTGGSVAPGASNGAGPSEPYGPPTPETGPAYGPEPVQIHPAVLVLGPGLARGYAYVGALRAFNEAHIPIGAVLGCEMGSLVGALYAVDGNFNHLEWALQRFKEEAFSGQGDLLNSFFKKAGSGRKLVAELEKTFGRKDISDSKIPLRIMIQPKGSEDPIILSKGELVPALRAALADPDLLQPGSWNGVDAQAARSVEPYLLKEARGLGIGPVIWVDAASQSSAVMGPSPDVDLMIRPDLGGIDRKDFTKRNSAVFRGKTSVKSELSRLRALVGLAPEPAAAQPEVTRQ